MSGPGGPERDGGGRACTAASDPSRSTRRSWWCAATSTSRASAARCVADQLGPTSHSVRLSSYPSALSHPRRPAGRGEDSQDEASESDIYNTFPLSVSLPVSFSVARRTRRPYGAAPDRGGPAHGRWRMSVTVDVEVGPAALRRV